MTLATWLVPNGLLLDADWWVKRRADGVDAPPTASMCQGRGV